MRSLARLVERHWDLGSLALGPILQRSPTRNVVSLRSDHGSFVVKAYEDDWALGLVHPSLPEIDQRLGIFDFLAAKGFGHAPSLLKTHAGDRFVCAGGMTLYLLKQIEGTHPPSSTGTWAELGRVAAKLNSITDYPHDYAIPVAGTIAELTRKAERYPFRRDILRLVSTFEALADEPTCLIHGEINLANTVLSPDGEIVLLDWDQAGNGPWMLEAGYPLITTFLSEDLLFDAGSAAAFYGSWTKGQEMSAGRKDLVFTAALMHALRYLEFGDASRRWRRIQYALAHKDELLAAFAAPDPLPAQEGQQ